MMRVALAAGLLVALAAPAMSQLPRRPPGSEYEGRAFTFEEVRPGIYHARGTGALAVGSNGAVIVNDEDVVVVDSHMTPAAAWALLRELREITDKPVRYVVNTHFHFDHVHGNQVFGPGVEIVSHEFTRFKIGAGASITGRGYDSFMGSTPQRIEALEEELAAAPAAEKAALEERLAALRKLWTANLATNPKPPGMTLSKRLTLYRGARVIHVLFLGRGHTGGDAVVFLPQEKVLVTGDLLTYGLPYMGDGFALEWAETLEELKSLDADVVLPGHGEAFEEMAKIDYLQHYLRDLWHKVSAGYAEGVTAADASERIDMTDHAEHFPQIEGPGVSRHAVDRIYELLEAAAADE